MDWAQKFKRCVKCKSTSTRYRCKGLCNRCYDIDRGRSSGAGPPYRAYKMPKISPAEKGYIAGLLDGEGCIGLYTYRDCNKKANLQISNTYRPVLEWICSKTSCGSIHACSKQATGFKSNKQCYNWTLSSQPHILAVLRELLPYLQIKKEKAAGIINFISSRPDKRVKE